MQHKITLKKNETCKICTCGKSKIIPICDNSHREFNEKKGTNYKSLKITPKEDTTLDITSKLWQVE